MFWSCCQTFVIVTHGKSSKTVCIQNWKLITIKYRLVFLHKSKHRLQWQWPPKSPWQACLASHGGKNNNWDVITLGADRQDSNWTPLESLYISSEIIKSASRLVEVLSENSEYWGYPIFYRLEWNIFGQSDSMNYINTKLDTHDFLSDLRSLAKIPSAPARQ